MKQERRKEGFDKEKRPTTKNRAETLRGKASGVNLMDKIMG